MIKALIIDDEIRAQRVLKSLLQEYIDDVEVIACCSDVPSAVPKINELNPDVVFCDIEMPNYTGLELLSFFQKVNFELIFATGYSEFAIQAFELSAVDYLLKPIQIEKLEAAIQKLKLKLERHSMADRLEVLKHNVQEQAIKKIALPMSDGLIFIDVQDIVLCEADGAYTKVWLADKPDILISKKLRFFENILESRNQFFRTHRSYILNINYIKKYMRAEGSIVMDNDQIVKVARDRKSKFEEHIEHIRL